MKRAFPPVRGNLGMELWSIEFSRGRGNEMAVYRPKYRDPKTGKLVESEIWWCNFRFAGKRYRESTLSTRKTVASEYEKKRRLEIERQYAGLPPEQPAKDRIRTVSEVLKAYKSGYKVNHREKSQAWVGERAAH